MLRRNVTVILFFLLVPCFLSAQVKTTKVDVKHRVVLTNPDYISPITDNTVRLNKANATVGLQIDTSNYDYMCNTTLHNQIIWWGGAKIAVHRRTVADATRRIFFTQVDSATNAITHIDVFGGAAGYPDIDVDRTDPSLVGTIGVVAHTPSRLGIFDGTSGFLVSEFGAGLDPTVQFAGPNIWLANSGNEGSPNFRNQFEFFKSTDGATFVNFDSIKAFSPKPIFWFANGSVEPGVTKSIDESRVVYYGCASASANGNKVYNGISPDSCDNFFIIESTDAGTSWVGSKLETDGEIGLVAGQPLYAPLVSNFSQVDVAVSNAGVIHAVANGYGPVFNNSKMDSTTIQVANFFPVLYYNSTTGKWITISDPKIDTNQILGSAAAAPGPGNNGGYPTNSIGNAYPKLSISENGKFLYCVWTGAEFSDNTYTKIDTASDAGLVNFWRDLYQTWSTDGGTTWAPVTVLAGAKNISEAFGSAAKSLRFDATQKKYIADVVYIADNTSGVSLFAGASSMNPIMYYQYAIPVVIDGVNDKNAVVNSFNLAQNYPNPFNPSTKINYTLGQKSNVSLKVFDMLGREVANLVNGSQEAGQHNVTFNASKLASGVYVYTLKANNNITSKKMMLMK